MAYMKKGRQGQKDWLLKWNKSDKKKEFTRQYFLAHNPVYMPGIVEKIQDKKGKKGVMSRLGVELSAEVKKKMKTSALQSWDGNTERKRKARESLNQRRPYMITPFKDTSIEIKIQKLLRDNGIDFETHYPILGQPDIFIKPNIAIFCDGDYWHNLPKAVERDKYVNETLRSQGYIIIRLWENEINSSLDSCLSRIAMTIPLP